MLCGLRADYAIVCGVPHTPSCNRFLYNYHGPGVKPTMCSTQNGGLKAMRMPAVHLIIAISRTLASAKFHRSVCGRFVVDG